MAAISILRISSAGTLSLFSWARGLKIWSPYISKCSPFENLVCKGLESQRKMFAHQRHSLLLLSP